MKKKLVALGAGVTSLAFLAFGSAPAWATVFDDNIIQDDVSVEVDGDEARIGHVYGWDGVSTSGTTNTHSAGELWLDDGTASWSAVCDESTAVTTTESNGDVVVDCDTENPDNSLSALEVSAQYRVYDATDGGVVLARMLYKIHNPSSAAVVVTEVGTELSWDEYGADWPMLTNSGDTVEDTDYSEDATLRWLNTAYYVDDGGPILASDATTFGGAIYGTNGAVKMVANGNLYDDDYLPFTAANVTVSAGATIYLAFYSVYAYAPQVVPPSANPQAALDNTDAFMTIFDGAYEGVLTAGIPSDAWVANWQPQPSLPNTGANDLTGFVVGGIVLTGLGLALTAIRRRRAA